MSHQKRKLRSHGPTKRNIRLLLFFLFLYFPPSFTLGCMDFFTDIHVYFKFGRQYMYVAD